MQNFKGNLLFQYSRHLRKCGKKMPRYCDVNSDRKITLSEWMNCLQVQRISPSPPEAQKSISTG